MVAVVVGTVRGIRSTLGRVGSPADDLTVSRGAIIVISPDRVTAGAAVEPVAVALTEELIVSVETYLFLAQMGETCRQV